MPGSRVRVPPLLSGKACGPYGLCALSFSGALRHDTAAWAAFAAAQTTAAITPHATRTALYLATAWRPPGRHRAGDRRVRFGARRRSPRSADGDRAPRRRRPCVHRPRSGRELVARVYARSRTRVDRPDFAGSGIRHPRPGRTRRLALSYPRCATRLAKFG